MFKLGDRFQVVGNLVNNSDIEGQIATIIGMHSKTCFRVRFESGNICENWYEQGDMRLIEEKSKSMSSLKQKFAIAFKGEPEKSFIKAEIMNVDESLTDDGESLLLAFLLKKFGAEFKTEVVDVILAEDEKTTK